MLKEEVYVTPDDYFNKFGEDLRKMLKGSDNDSTAAERFIANVTDHLKQWIDSTTFRVVRYEWMTEFQTNQFKKAILNQCFYTLQEGYKALGLISGIDDERGAVITYDTIRRMQVCPSAVDCLRNAGLFNLTVRNMPRVLGGYPEYGFYEQNGGKKGN